MGSMLIYIGGVLLVTYLALAAVLYVMQSKFLYSPEREVSSTPAELGLDFEGVVFKSSDGLDLSGWYIRFFSATATAVIWRTVWTV